MQEKNKHCQFCGKTDDETALFPVELIRPQLLKFIQQAIPKIDLDGEVCLEELNKYRSSYLEHLMQTEIKEAKKLRKKFNRELSNFEVLSENTNDAFDEKLKFGDRLADKIASFGGSWKFIIIFSGILFVWIIINTIVLLIKPFDPYPFILLNLILSCLAAIQAPIIMMSQNRQEAKDRLKSDHDYKINMKAEFEIRHLNDKIDHLLIKQWKQLEEIQQFQSDLMDEIIKIKKS